MGGRRRSAVNKPPPRRKPKLDKLFRCPICSHEGCTVTRTKREKQEEMVISCKVCKESHKLRKRVTYLTEPIDVFSDWIDFLKHKGKPSSTSVKRSAPSSSSALSSSSSSAVKKSKAEEEEEDEELFNTPSIYSKKKDGDDDEEEEDDDEDDDKSEEEDDEDQMD